VNADLLRKLTDAGQVYAHIARVEGLGGGGGAPAQVPGPELQEGATMCDVLQQIWRQVRPLIENPCHWLPTSGSMDLTGNVCQGLIASKAAVASHYGLPAGDLQYFRSEGQLTEYLLDFTWTTYPPNRRFDYEARHDWRAGQYGILLACECESHGFSHASANYQAVLEDFVKLLDVKSKIKVMAYRIACQDVGQQVADLRSAFEHLLCYHQGYDRTELWLFIGVPWYRTCWPDSQNLNLDIQIADHDCGITLQVPPWAGPAPVTGP
jgi:hypothetical protein